MSECGLVCLSCASRHHFAESRGRENEEGGVSQSASRAPDSGAAKGLIIPTKLYTICETVSTSFRQFKNNLIQIRISL